MGSIKSLTKSVVYGALAISTSRRGIKRTIGGEEIRFPARWFRYYEADYEPETFSFLRANLKEGQTALDVGAHIGLFSVVMARLVGASGHVFSFEPTPLTNKVLKETVRLNRCEEIVEVRAEAVSNKTGTATFYDTGHAASNANSLVKGEKSRGGLEVKTTSIDDFAGARGLSVNCIKIDVEGAELHALRGGARTFAEHRPVVSLGLHPPFLGDAKADLSEIWKLLRDYRMAVVYKGQAVEEAWFCQQRDLFDVHLFPQ
jgi:FkbM family methyltransferase